MYNRLSNWYSQNRIENVSIITFMHHFFRWLAFLRGTEMEEKYEPIKLTLER